MTLDPSISFRTERFDRTSELPADCNAGNRFYGRDVAAWLCEHLAAAGLQADYLDEDWGWFVQGVSAPSMRFEIAVYSLDDDDMGCRPGAPGWGLGIRAFERTRVLGLFPGKMQVLVPETVMCAVRDAIIACGSMPAPWQGDAP